MTIGRFISNVFLLLWHMFRRNTLCRLGVHKKIMRREVLALGEVLETPGCAIFGCGYLDTSNAKITKPYKGDGMLFAMSAGPGPLIPLGPVTLGNGTLEDVTKEKLEELNAGSIEQAVEGANRTSHLLTKMKEAQQDHLDVLS